MIASQNCDIEFHTVENNGVPGVAIAANCLFVIFVLRAYY